MPVAPTTPPPAEPQSGTLTLQRPAVAGHVWLDGQNWPEDGEIDVMEGLGGWAAYHLHFGSSGEGADAVGAAVNSTPGTHTYGILWTTTGVTFIYDGQQEQTLNESLTSPEYLLMENSLGSGPYQIPSTVQVRYVRVWQ